MVSSLTAAKKEKKGGGLSVKSGCGGVAALIQDGAHVKDDEQEEGVEKLKDMETVGRKRSFAILFIK